MFAAAGNDGRRNPAAADPSILFISATDKTERAATFTTTAVEKLDVASGKPNYRVTGDLTIKGITHPNTFDVLFWMEGKEARAAATITFDRTKYDIKYRSGTFFPEIGDKAISDAVTLTFDVSAK